MRILEKKFAAYLLVIIYNNEGMSKSAIANMDKGNLFSKYARLDEMESAGIIRIDSDKRFHNTKLVYLTDTGKEIARRLNEIHDMLPPSECTGEEY